MRVPWSRIYRAFPELDAFSDEECERYVLQVRRQRFGQWKYWLLGFLLVVLWLILLLPLTVLVAQGLGLASSGVVLGFFIVMPLGVFIPAAMYRDRLLIRAIRDRLNLARCTRCGHSLLGLPLLVAEAEETVRCPECGSVMVLRELGLRHEELIPQDEEGPSGSPAAPRDVHPAPRA